MEILFLTGLFMKYKFKIWGVYYNVGIQLNVYLKRTHFWQHGGDVNAADHTGQTALHWSAVRGAIQVAELLLQEGARINTVDSYGYQVSFFISALFLFPPSPLSMCTIASVPKSLVSVTSPIRIPPSDLPNHWNRWFAVICVSRQSQGSHETTRKSLVSVIYGRQFLRGLQKQTYPIFWCVGLKILSFFYHELLLILPVSICAFCYTKLS